MPRRARMYVPGLPYHIVQRGNNREACFAEPENYQFYLELWRKIHKNRDRFIYTQKPGQIYLQGFLNHKELDHATDWQGSAGELSASCSAART